MNLKLSKTAIRELTKRYRAVLMAAVAAGAFVATGANAGTITIPETGNVTGASGVSGNQTYTIVEATSETTHAIATVDKITEEITDLISTKEGNISAMMGFDVTKNPAGSDTNALKQKLTGNNVAGKTDIVSAINAAGNAVGDLTTTGVTGTSAAAQITALNTGKLGASDIIAGTNNGTISVGGTDVFVTGLAAAAYKDVFSGNLEDGTTSTNLVTAKQVVDYAQSATQVKAAINNAAGLGLTQTTDGVLDINLATNSGLQIASDALSVKAKTNGGINIGSDGLEVLTGTTTQLLSGNLEVKYGSQFTQDGNGLKLNSGAVDTNELKVGAVTLDKISLSAFDSAVTASSGYLVTSGTVYSGIVDNAQEGKFTGTPVTGGSGTTLKGALTETNNQVNTNTTKISNHNTTLNTLAGLLNGQTVDTTTGSLSGTASKYSDTSTGYYTLNNSDNLTNAVGKVNATVQNVLLTASGDHQGYVNSQKVDVQWRDSNGDPAASTLDAVLGSGNYTSTNNIAKGGSVTTALSALDKAVGNTTFSGKNATGSADLTAAVNALDNAIGDRDITTTNSAVKTALGTSVSSAIAKIGDQIGTATFTTKNTSGTVVADLTEAVNLIGDASKLTGNSLNKNDGTTPATLVEALTNIDYRLGTIHGLYDGTTVAATTNGIASTVNGNSNLAVGTSVDDHLVSLDNAIGDRTLASGNAAIDSALSGTSVSAAIQAAGQAIGDLDYTSTNYLSAADDNLTKAVSTLDSNLDRVEGKLDSLGNHVNKMHHEMKSGFASLAAMSALVPNARVAGDTQIAMGTGYYRGTTGFALGAFHHINDNVLLNAGASYAGNGSAVFKGGVTFGF